MHDPAEQQMYVVTLAWSNGSSKTIRVATDRGVAKAVLLASLTLMKNPFGKVPLEVGVESAGPLPKKADGEADIDGCIVDRNEW